MDTPISTTRGASFLPGNLPNKQGEAKGTPVEAAKIEPTPRRKNERGARIDETEDAWFERTHGFSKLAKRRQREQRG